MKKINLRHKNKVSNNEHIGYINNNNCDNTSKKKCGSRQYNTIENVKEYNSLDNLNETNLINQLKEREKNINTHQHNIEVNKNVFLEKDDLSHIKASRENSLLSLKIPVLLNLSDTDNSSKQMKVYFNTQCKNKTVIFEKNDNKNDISYDITVNRDTRQYIKNKNNENLKIDDNIIKESSENFKTLNKKDLIFIKDNTEKNDTVNICQPNCRKQTLITKQKLNLFDNITCKLISNDNLNFNQTKNKELSDLLKKKNDFELFPSVEKLVKMYTQHLQNQNNERNIVKGGNFDDKNNIDCSTINSLTSYNLNKRNNIVLDEGCQSGQSNYSDSEENVQQIYKIYQNNLARTYSRDSALDLDDEISNMSFVERRNSTDSIIPINFNNKRKQQERRNTLTITDIPLRTALLPLAQPIDLLDSSNLNIINEEEQNTIQIQNNVPSKILIEERIVEIPHDMSTLNISRRESAQSCSSEYTNSSEYGGKRYVRTPSVVVSDYSDDVMCGITLEEIEYFKKQRMRRRSSGDTALTEKDDTLSDVSGASSCSNLNYCGSTISILDGAECYINGIRTEIHRNNSESSLCSNSTEASCNDVDDILKIDNCYNSSEDISNTDILNNNTKKEKHSEQKV